MNQSLFDPQPEPDSIDARFEVFDQENPQIYEYFKRLATEALDAGKKTYSSDAILHRIRWHFDIETRSLDFKLNDHFTSRYARKLMREDARFKGFFKTRQLRSTA